ncbi:MAG: PH domain-containing protein, partial [Clostridia bacterium]|nr:PH domain-containing protein [Clostridia bacterium]
VGNLKCETNDRSSGNFTIELVKNPRQVKELLSDAVEAERDRKRVSVREFMADMGDEAAEDDYADDAEISE